MRKRKEDGKKMYQDELVKRIAREKCISEASVRTVLAGLTDVVTEEVAKGKDVKLMGLGVFRLKIQKVHYQFVNRDHQEERERVSLNPHFRCSPVFKSKVQVMNGVTPSFCHRSKEKQEEYVQHLNDNLNLNDNENYNCQSDSQP